MAFKLDGNPLAVDVAFSHNDINYPANWLRLSTADEKKALGITEVSDSPTYDSRFYNGDGSGKELDDVDAKDQEGNLLKYPDGTAIRKGYNIKRGKYSLDDLIAGKYPDYPVWKLKSRLLLNGYMLDKCSCCGFEEKRLSDGKVPLVLDFIDGDRKNHKYDNLRMLCFNCSFLLNGNLTGPKKEYEY